MDFGIAKHLGSTGGVTVTATGSLMGTPEYMSPEQLRGEDVDFRGDLYSLAVVIFELFTGALPFRGETPVATILRQLHDAPFLELPQLPTPLRPVLARALAKDPADRYATAVDMRRALQAACAQSAPGILPVLGTSPAEHGPSDETRPVVLVAERPPIARMAVAQAALAVLAVHLVSAGGVATPPAPPTPSPAPKTIVTIEVAATPPRPRGATSRAPVAARTPQPTPLPKAPLELPTRPLRQLQQPPTPSEPKVYNEDDVDVPPRLVSGAIAPYPDWGPKLARGARVSITASFVVNEAGDVTDIRVEQGRGVLEAVLVEMSRWKYEPGQKDGRPVKVRVSFKHSFVGG
jgi:serine/threonine-protein kinase